MRSYASGLALSHHRRQNILTLLTASHNPRVYVLLAHLLPLKFRIHSWVYIGHPKTPR